MDPYISLYILVIGNHKVSKVENEKVWVSIKIRCPISNFKIPNLPHHNVFFDVLLDQNYYWRLWYILRIDIHKGALQYAIFDEFLDFPILKRTCHIQWTASKWKKKKSKLLSISLNSQSLIIFWMVILNS